MVKDAIQSPVNSGLQAKDFVELGFIEMEGGVLLKKVYRDFVIDALPPVVPIPGGYQYWFLELRAGDARICGKVRNLPDLTALIRILEAKTERDTD